MRTIACSYKEFSKDEWERLSAENNQWAEDADKDRLDMSDMTLIGIFGLRNPLRPGVEETVNVLKNKMGINVRMTTGDSLVTARHVAINAGIATKEELEDEDACMEDVFDRAAETVASKLKIASRCNPEAKSRIVHDLAYTNKTVAYVGDGTNDAPALKEAHVGIVMGHSGTDSAK